MPYRETELTRRRRADRRARVVEATRSLVAEGGLAAVSMRRVATRAEIATGTVYRYFPSKEALVAEVIAGICRREIELLAAIAGRRDRPATVRLREAVTCFAERTLASGRTAYAVIAEPSVPEIERLRTSLRRDLAGVFETIVVDGVASREFPDQPADVVGLSVVGAVSEVLVGPVGATPTGRHHRVTVDVVVELVMRAVGANTDIPEIVVA